MHASIARDIIEKFNLVRRRDSKTLIKHISSPGNSNAYTVSHLGLSKKHILSLRDEFKKTKKRILEGSKNRPTHLKNEVILQMIKARLPWFEWASKKIINKNGKSQTSLIFSDLFYQNIRVTLATALLRPELIEQSDQALNFKFLRKFKNEFIQKLDHHIFSLGLANFNETQASLIVEWLKLGVDGKKLTIISPICPDYAHVDLGNGFYNFTFDGLGIEVGVTGRRLVENKFRLFEFIADFDLNVEFIAAYGDFECLSQTNLRRLGVDQKEFLKRLGKSQEAFQKLAGNRFKTIMFTDLCGGFEQWKNTTKRCHDCLIKRDFGGMRFSNTDLDDLILARKPLLERWFGEQSKKELQNKVIEQGAEYSAMGMIINQNLINPLVLGVDHYKMAPFYSFNAKMPVLYLSSNYLKN